MKRTAIAAIALLCLAGTAAAQRHIKFKDWGVYSVIDLSYAANLNRGADINGKADTLTAYAFSLIGGFQFNQAVGVGAGATYLHDPAGTFTMLPAFVELRSHFLDGRISPYTLLQVGYAFPIGSSGSTEKVEKGGVYFGAEGGVRFAINRHLAIGLHAGYRLLGIAQLDRFDNAQQPLLTGPVTLHIANAGVTLHL